MRASGTCGYSCSHSQHRALFEHQLTISAHRLRWHKMVGTSTRRAWRAAVLSLLVVALVLAAYRTFDPPYAQMLLLHATFLVSLYETRRLVCSYTVQRVSYLLHRTRRLNRLASL